MRPFVRPIALFAALALVGCGQAAPNRPKRPATSLRPMIQPAGTPMGGMPMAGMPMPGASGAGQAKGAELLQRARQTLSGVTGFEGEIMTRTQGHYKSGKRVSELVKESIGYKVVWAKPAKFRAEVFNAPSAMMEGAGIVTQDGMAITARAKGLLSFVPIKLTARDPQLANVRNHTFDKYSPMAQIQRLSGPTAVWTVISEGVAPSGAPLAFVAIDGVKRLDAEISREVYALEVPTLAPHSLSAFAGAQKVADYSFQKFRWNPKVTAETFKM